MSTSVASTPATAPKIRQTGILIGDEFRSSVSGKMFETINPATEEVICEVAEGDAADVDLAVHAARAAFESGPWSRMDARERGRLMLRLADLAERNLDELASLETLDNGKPINDSRAADLPLATVWVAARTGWRAASIAVLASLNWTDADFSTTVESEGADGPDDVAARSSGSWSGVRRLGRRDASRNTSSRPTPPTPSVNEWWTLMISAALPSSSLPIWTLTVRSLPSRKTLTWTVSLYWSALVTATAAPGQTPRLMNKTKLQASRARRTDNITVSCVLLDKLM